MPGVNDLGQAMFKSVLFRPLRPVGSGSEYEAFLACVDSLGRFTVPWRVWYEEQSRCAVAYAAKERAAGKLFTLEDLRVSGGPSETAPSLLDLAPTPADFFAHITVTVATNLDAAAEARGGARRPLRPNPDEFAVPELDVPPGGERPVAEPVPGAPAGDEGAVDDLPDTELSKLREPLVPVPDGRVRAVAYCAEINVSSVLRKYRENFMKGMGEARMPRNAAGRESASVEANLGHATHGAALREILATQGALLDYKRTRHAATEEHAVAASTGGVQMQGGVCPPARLEILPEGLRPRDYVMQRVRELATDAVRPLELGEDQMDFLALVTQKGGGSRGVAGWRPGARGTGVSSGAGSYLAVGAGGVR